MYKILLWKNEKFGVLENLTKEQMVVCCSAKAVNEYIKEGFTHWQVVFKPVVIMPQWYPQIHKPNRELN